MLNEKLNIFLGGGGSKRDSTLLDDLFVRTLPPDGIIAYVPFATNEFSLPECFDWIRDVFPGKEIDMWPAFDANSDSRLQTAGGIYIGGGSPLKLLSLATANHFDRTLTEWALAGGIIYGGSAGATILGSVVYTRFKQTGAVGFTDVRGLDLLSGFSIWCHYNSAQDMMLLEENKRVRRILALSEKSGARVVDGHFVVVGFDAAVVFENGEKTIFNPNEEFS